MSRVLSLVSGIGLLVVVVMSVLIFFGVINPINWIKYLILLSSISLSFFSLGIFIRRSELSKIFMTFIVLLLILPSLVPFVSMFKPDIITSCGKVFYGGSIFQIGTGIFTLSGGFMRNGDWSFLKILNLINYLIFIFLAVILVFNFEPLMELDLFFVLGIVLSVLSLSLVFFRRKQVELIS